MSTNTLAKREHYAERRLRAESDAAALHGLAVLCSEGAESAEFLEADAASEQAMQKWIEADRATRRGWSRITPRPLLKPVITSPGSDQQGRSLRNTGSPCHGNTSLRTEAALSWRPLSPTAPPQKIQHNRRRTRMTGG